MDLKPGQVVRFKNPEDGMPDVGEFLGVVGGDLKIRNRDGIVYVPPSYVLRNNSKDQKSRKNRRKNRKASRKASRRSSRG
jgi:hypothetical protein